MPQSVYSITLEKPDSVYTKTPAQGERLALSHTINCLKNLLSFKYVSDLIFSNRSIGLFWFYICKAQAV